MEKGFNKGIYFLGRFLTDIIQTQAAFVRLLVKST